MIDDFSLRLSLITLRAVFTLGAPPKYGVYSGLYACLEHHRWNS